MITQELSLETDYLVQYITQLLGNHTLPTVSFTQLCYMHFLDLQFRFQDEVGYFKSSS